MKNIARLSFLLITLLWGSFYAITKEALGRIDPVLFTFFELVILVPAALLLVVINWGYLDKAAIKRGVVLGSWLCLAMLTMTVAIKFTQAANTAFFPSISGVVATLITGCVLKRQLGKAVWTAAILSLSGTVIMMATAGGGIVLRGDLIAFLATLFFTVYFFLVDRDRQVHDPQKGERTFWLVLGIEHLTMALWIALIALLFGDWQHLHPIFPKDAVVILYVGVGTVFVPVVLSVFMQKYIDPLEVAFLSILEPIWGVIIAYLYLGETLPLIDYLGGGLLIAGAVLHTGGTFNSLHFRRRRRAFSSLKGQHVLVPIITTIGYPILLLAGGISLLERFGGFPPAVWLDLYRMWPEMLTLINQGQGIHVVLLCLGSAFWLMAWIALMVIGIQLAIAAARNLLATSRGGTSIRSVTAKHQGMRVSQAVSSRPLTTRKLTSPVAQRRLAAREQRLDTGGLVVLREPSSRSTSNKDFLPEKRDGATFKAPPGGRSHAAKRPLRIRRWRHGSNTLQSQSPVAFY